MLHYTVNQQLHWTCRQYSHSGEHPASQSDMVFSPRYCLTFRGIDLQYLPKPEEKGQPQVFVKNTLSSTYCAKAEPSATQTLVPSLALLELFSPAFKNKGSDSQ